MEELTMTNSASKSRLQGLLGIKRYSKPKWSFYMKRYQRAPIYCDNRHSLHLRWEMLSSTEMAKSNRDSPECDVVMGTAQLGTHAAISAHI